MNTARVTPTSPNRLDIEAIVGLVPPTARVLDLGCGDGNLLSALVQRKQVVARGVEIDESNVRACISRGLSVRHGNIEEGLADYRDNAFDYVILSQTIAYLDQPESVVREMLRVGKFGIISFDNAGCLRDRWRALLGRGSGYDLCSGQPRMRAITIPQFIEFCACTDSVVVQSVFLTQTHRVTILAALRAATAVFVLSH